MRAQDCVSEVFFLAPALPAHRSAGQIVIRPPSSAMAGRSRSPPSSRAPSRRAEPIPVHQRTETQITRLRGKSGTSRVNVSIQRGRLSSQGLAGFRAAFAVELHTTLLPSKNTPGDAEIFFRLSEKVRAQKPTGRPFE